MLAARGCQASTRGRALGTEGAPSRSPRAWPAGAALAAAAGPLQPPPLGARAPPALPSLPTPPPAPRPPSVGSLGLPPPGFSSAPGRELVGAWGLLLKPSAAEPGGSAARPAAGSWRSPSAAGARAGVGTAEERRAGGRESGAAPAPWPHSRTGRRPAWLVRLSPAASCCRELGTAGSLHLRPQPGGESREPRALIPRGLGLQVVNFINSGG